MATPKKCIKIVFYTNEDGGNNNKILGKLSRTTVVSTTIKSYNQLNFLNLVTMATDKNEKKSNFGANKEGSKEYIGFGEIILDNWFPWQQNNLISLVTDWAHTV